MPAVWQSHPHPTAIFPAVPRPRSAPSGQLMISLGPNPLALRRCLPGRPYSTCAHAPSAAAALPISAPDFLSQSRFCPLPTAPRLPTHPLGGIHNPPLLLPKPHTTTLETKQYRSEQHTSELQSLRHL